MRTPTLNPMTALIPTPYLCEALDWWKGAGDREREGFGAVNLQMGLLMTTRRMTNDEDNSTVNTK